MPSISMIGPLPYTISVPEEKISKLKQKLAWTTWPDELNGAKWDLGAPLKDVKRLAEYWQNGYDWRQQEAKLNELPQYTTKLEVLGKQLNIHFIHSKSPVPGAIPLLFCHGCKSHSSVPPSIESDVSTRARKLS